MEWPGRVALLIHWALVVPVIGLLIPSYLIESHIALLPPIGALLPFVLASYELLIWLRWFEPIQRGCGDDSISSTDQLRKFNQRVVEPKHNLMFWLKLSFSTILGGFALLICLSGLAIYITTDLPNDGKRGVPEVVTVAELFLDPHRATLLASPNDTVSYEGKIATAWCNVMIGIYRTMRAHPSIWNGDDVLKFQDEWIAKLEYMYQGRYAMSRMYEQCRLQVFHDESFFPTTSEQFDDHNFRHSNVEHIVDTMEHSVAPLLSKQHDMLATVEVDIAANLDNGTITAAQIWYAYERSIPRNAGYSRMKLFNAWRCIVWHFSSPSAIALTRAMKPYLDLLRWPSSRLSQRTPEEILIAYLGFFRSSLTEQVEISSRSSNIVQYADKARIRLQTVRRKMCNEFGNFAQPYPADAVIPARECAGLDGMTWHIFRLDKAINAFDSTAAYGNHLGTIVVHNVMQELSKAEQKLIEARRTGRTLQLPSAETRKRLNGLVAARYDSIEEGATMRRIGN